MPGRTVDVGFAVMTGEGFNERHVAGGERLTDLVMEAERVGFDSVVLPDHLRWDIERGPHGFRESTTLLAAFAALTSRVRLGTGVLNGPFRNPGLVAKIAVTIDEISSGRFTLGLGAGGGPPVEYSRSGSRGITTSPASPRRFRSSTPCCARGGAISRAPTTRPRIVCWPRPGRVPAPSPS